MNRYLHLYNIIIIKFKCGLVHISIMIKNNKKTIILRLKFPNFIQRGKVIERLFKEDKDRY